MPTQHPRQRLLNGFCRLHRLLVRAYPAQFRQEFRDELIVTYRDYASDRLRDDGLGAAISLLLSTIGDWLHTLGTARRDASTTVLCLTGRDTRVAAFAGEQTVALLLASLGVLLMLTGWVQWVRHEADLFRHYSYQEIALNRSGTERGRVLMKRAGPMLPSTQQGAKTGQVAP